MNNNSTSSLLSQIQQLQSQRKTGRLRLSKRDGTDINLFFEGGTLVHAQHGWTFGVPAFQEASKWHDYETNFTSGIPTPLRSINPGDISDIASVASDNSSKYEVPKQLTGYFYAEKHTTTDLSTLEVDVLAHANGNSFEDLLIQTQQNPTTLAATIKQLTQKRLLSIEQSPCTPEQLKALRLRKKEVKAKGLLGMFSKKNIELTDLEFKVYDVLNGAVSLWDIHLNLGLAREQVWEAYTALKKRDLVENLA